MLYIQLTSISYGNNQEDLSMNEITLNWNEYTESAIKTAAEGIVMIENKDKVLPLKTGARVALFGRMQIHYYKSGTGSGGMVNVHHVTDIREGLNDCESVTLDAELMDIYDKWDEQNPIDAGLGWGKEAWSQAEMPVSLDLAEKLASRNDYAVIIIARTAGEDRDNSAEKGAYFLSDSEEEMLANVTRAFDKTIVLLNVGNIIDMSFVEKYGIKSVLYVWQAGMIGGISAARVLTGKENPSGALPDTIAKKLEDYPSDANFLKDIKEDIYQEDIFVGYRYFSTFDTKDVLYPFGFGLSYTSFELSGISFDYDSEKVTVSATVKNTGSVSGKKAVMLYCKAPDGKLSKPSRVLAGFTKTGNIPSGCEERITITAPFRRFASFDDDGRTGFGTTGFVLEKGTSDSEAISSALNLPVLSSLLKESFLKLSRMPSFRSSPISVLRLSPTVTAHIQKARRILLLRLLISLRQEWTGSLLRSLRPAIRASGSLTLSTARIRWMNSSHSLPMRISAS